MKIATFLVLLAVAPVALAADGAGHGPASERLKSVMDGIHRSILAQTEEGGSGAVEGLEELTGAVEELLYHAEMMTPQSAPRPLTTTQVVTFRALAAQLYDQALNVRDIAAAPPRTPYEFNQLDATLERLYQTCAACHELFRAPAP